MTITSNYNNVLYSLQAQGTAAVTNMQGPSSTTSLQNFTINESATVEVTTSSVVSNTTYSTVYSVTEQAFNLSCSGLRPSTLHYFTFNNANVSSQCQPVGGVLGGPLTTNTSGQISFVFFYNSGIAANTLVSSEQAMINNIVGNKAGILSSADGLSSANITITISA